MKVKKHIPNFITSCNLVCGFAGIVFAFQGHIGWSVYLIWIAMVFDFLDGLTARILKVHSEIGKQLDSLADMVTFGVLPAIIIYHLLTLHPTSYTWLPFIAVLIAVFSALRLAKFNIDENQASVFIGVPTPANALFLSSIPMVQDQYPEIISLPVLIIITVICSLWLVAPVELFSLKFKNIKWQENQLRFVFIIVCLALIILLKKLALPLIILIYVTFSFVKYVLPVKA